MLEIDGSFGEGGGQILRTALSLSLITGKSFVLRNVRANRKPKPGLQPQHLASVRAAAEIGSAHVSGATIGSSYLKFEPQHVTPGRYHFPIGTAGATGLVLHTVYLPLAWNQSGPSEVVIEGGTHVRTSPCYHFLETTWASYLHWMGFPIRLELRRPGFYPRGGGLIIAHIPPVRELHPVHFLECPAITKVHGWSAAASLPEHVATRQARTAIESLRKNKILASVSVEMWDGGPGSVIGLTLTEPPVPAFFVGIGERGKPAETVAEEAVKQVCSFTQAGAPVDKYSADQIVLPLALAQGASEFRVEEVTLHLHTNIAVIQMFLNRTITCEGELGSPGIVRIGAPL